MSYIMQTQNLTKTYGKKDAAKDININIREGEIYGLIGRNGAGKTTIMRMISKKYILSIISIILKIQEMKMSLRKMKIIEII